MSKKIASLTGEIDAKEMGYTLTHEHYVSLDWSMRIAFPELFEENLFIERAVYLVKKAMKQGLRTIVDLTCINNGRDIELMKKISERTGLRTIFCTGLYFNEEPWIPGRDAGFIADLFVKELTKGVWESGVRPGVIKCATDRYGFSEINMTLLRASGIAAYKTGVPVFTHTVADMKHGLEQQSILEREKVDLRKVVIGHVGDTNDLNYVEELMKRGSYVGLDRFGSKGKLTDEERINNLLRLIDHGYIRQLLISHDYPLFYDWGENNWQTEKAIPVDKVRVGFSHIPMRIIPALRERGVSQPEIDILMIENPRNLFEC